ncbi:MULTISPECIES: glutaredoxin family protein [Bacillus cereus group]|uniref:glutaredoxin family protein n=1 Tax=Bacillus cereus group TaxID=86661 RepID=UPI0002D999A3|nr:MULTISPECIES: glutaredoxin family protein [Bacillus cereus group]MCU4733620.1 glutaredoxin family protein [Bacillus cereus]MCU5149238.1 glutaredoxin family protein [Bacillus cereus]MCU5496248.1 glutaredoxin family protein [Bacillus cereus]MCU5639327.1 glutaredoxin family protein [Bacillus cereus]MCU5702272.1 glutaredoxin family protein [Bacillus cereus]
MQQEVILYGSDTCHYCVLGKKWLQDNNINYTMKDLTEQKYQEEFNQFQANGIPLFIIKNLDNQTVQKIVGFNRERLEKAFTL